MATLPQLNETGEAKNKPLAGNCWKHMEQKVGLNRLHWISRLEFAEGTLQVAARSNNSCLCSDMQFIITARQRKG